MDSAQKGILEFFMQSFKGGTRHSEILEKLIFIFP